MSEQEREELFRDGALTVTALKAEFGIGRTTAYALMESGKLPYTQVGTRRLIPRRAVAKMLAQSLMGGTEDKP